jgi:hypothetical protein
MSSFSRYRLYQQATKIKSSSRPFIGAIHLDSAVFIVAKAMLNNPYAIFNELVAVKLASFLGLPVANGLPLSGFSCSTEPRVKKETIFWGSISVGEELPPADCETMVKENELVASGLIVFDGWIINLDRNECNLTYRVDCNEIIAFDHEMSICGCSGLDHLQKHKLDLSFLDGHAVAYHLKSLRFISYWIERICKIHDERIWGAVEQHSDLLPNPIEYNKVAEELILRKKMLAYWFRDLQRNHAKTVFPCLEHDHIPLLDVCSEQPPKIVVEVPNDSSYSI